MLSGNSRLLYGAMMYTGILAYLMIYPHLLSPSGRGQVSDKSFVCTERITQRGLLHASMWPVSDFPETKGVAMCLFYFLLQYHQRIYLKNGISFKLIKQHIAKECSVKQEIRNDAIRTKLIQWKSEAKKTSLKDLSQVQNNFR